MENLGKTARRWGEIASRAERVLLIGCLCMIVAIVFFGIIARYTPISGHTLWTAELARLFLLWAAFWSAGAIERAGGHFRLELIDSVLPAKALSFLQVFIKLLLLIALGILIFWTFDYYGGVTGSRTLILQWPETVRVVPLLLGSMLLFTHCLIGFIQNLRRWCKKC